MASKSGSIVDDIFISFDRLFGCSGPRKLALSFDAFRAQLVKLTRVAQNLSHKPGPVLGPFRRFDQRRIACYFGKGAARAGDDGTAARERLQQGKAKPFVAAWRKVEVRGAV